MTDRLAIHAAVNRVLADHPDAQFYLTGHSLGGMQSTLGLGDLASACKPLRSLPLLVILRSFLTDCL